ncbi:MAG: hypothetical protein WD294_14500 [Phycisphaeraceae bacterium]
MSFPRDIAEQNFTQAAADAALFELRVRLLAGAVPSTADRSIDTALAEVISAIIAHFQAKLSETDAQLLRGAARLRNKVLHCEFSSARHRLDPEGTLNRSGGVMKISGVTPDNVLSILDQINAGGDVGQQPVAGTRTKKHKDVFGWLLEAQGAGEFTAASHVLREAVTVLGELSVDKS